MLPLQYTYFIGTVICLVIWSLFFLNRSDLRKPMLISGIFLMLYGLPLAYFWWAKDWWHPLTLTRTTIGIEDIILGFSTGGIVTAFYPTLFQKKIKMPKKFPNISGLIAMTAFHLALIGGLISLMELPSALATIIGYGVSAIILLFLRRDMLFCALATGIAAFIFSLPIYLLLQTFTPAFVQSTWSFEYLSGILLFGVPIEDPLFYFTVGLFFGPYYYFSNNDAFIQR